VLLAAGCASFFKSNSLSGNNANSYENGFSNGISYLSRKERVDSLKTNIKTREEQLAYLLRVYSVTPQRWPEIKTRSVEISEMKKERAILEEDMNSFKEQDKF
jgi:hypothetical protein